MIGVVRRWRSAGELSFADMGCETEKRCAIADAILQDSKMRC